MTPNLQRMLYKKLFYSGISGLTLPIKQSQFPAEFQGKSRLKYYASLFNSIEINSIFYKLPKGATIANWSESVADDFRFTFKVSKTITHSKGLQFAAKDVKDFVNAVENVGDKKGCLLAQFPPSIKFDKIDRLQKFLETIGEATDKTNWKLAVEFRDSSWYEKEVNELLAEFDATRVIQDMPKSATPIEDVKSDFIYFRFHGPEPRYRGDYSDSFLKNNAEQIKKWIREKKTVYVYFNNTVGEAFKNLQTLNKYVLNNDE